MSDLANTASKMGTFLYISRILTRVVMDAAKRVEMACKYNPRFVVISSMIHRFLLKRIPNDSYASIYTLILPSIHFHKDKMKK